MSKTLKLCFLIGLVAAMAIPAAHADKKIPTAEEILTANRIGLKTPELIAALSNTKPDIRENAALIIGKTGVKQALPVLRKILNDPYPYARLAAAFALAKLGDETGTKVLSEALDSPDAYVVAYASARLAEAGNQAGYDALVKTAISADKTPSERILAIRTLGHFSKTKGESLSAMLDGILLNDKDNNVRRVAVDELKAYPGEKVQKVFIRLSDDKDTVVQGIAKKYLQNPSAVAPTPPVRP